MYLRFRVKTTPFITSMPSQSLYCACSSTYVPFPVFSLLGIAFFSSAAFAFCSMLQRILTFFPSSICFSIDYSLEGHQGAYAWFNQNSHITEACPKPTCWRCRPKKMLSFWLSELSTEVGLVSGGRHRHI